MDWIYIDDVISGLSRWPLKFVESKRTIDIGSGSLTSVRHIVAHLSRLTGSDRYAGIRGVAGPAIRAGARRLMWLKRRARLAWRPAVSMIEGLRLTVDAVQATSR